jgi:hypothetical protein
MGAIGNTGRIASAIAVILSLATLTSGCRPSEPQPDHIGLFAVYSKEIRELPRLEPNEMAESLKNLDGFFALFSKSPVLESTPDYLILYDPQFTPGNLHIARLNPTWARAAFAVPEMEVRLQVEPFEKPAGMYRLRPQRPLEPGYYVIGGAGPASVGGNGYFTALCARCALDETHNELNKIRAEEAARLATATIPSKTLAQSAIAFWYGPWPQSLNWNVTVTNTNISWTGYGSATIGYWEIQAADLVAAPGPWGGILCLHLPPKIAECNNTVQVSTIMAADEIPKLRTIAQAAQDALVKWKHDYPNGLPYAFPEGAGAARSGTGETASAQNSPSSIAPFLANNPSVEFVAQDPAKGTVTLRQKTTGETVTVRIQDVEQGRVRLK